MQRWRVSNLIANYGVNSYVVGRGGLPPQHGEHWGGALRGGVLLSGVHHAQNCHKVE